LAASRFAAVAPAVKAAPASNRALGERPADLLLREQPADRRGQGRLLQAARRVDLVLE
jgi:hypothetical protein